MTKYKDLILALVVALFFFTLGVSKGLVLHEKTALIDRHKDAYTIAVDNAAYFPQSLAVDLGSELGRPVEIQAFGSNENLENLLNQKNPPDLIIAPQSDLEKLDLDKLETLNLIDDEIGRTKLLVESDFISDKNHLSAKAMPLFWGFSKIKTETTDQSLSLIEKYKEGLHTIVWPDDFYETCNWLQYFEKRFTDIKLDTLFTPNKKPLVFMSHSSPEKSSLAEEGTFLWVRAFVIPTQSILKNEVLKAFANKEFYLKWLLATPSSGTFKWLNSESSIVANRKPMFLREQSLNKFLHAESCPKRFWMYKK
jgi:hypothetical protein